jgi:hypothetical protein
MTRISLTVIVAGLASLPASAAMLGPTAYSSLADSPFNGGSFVYFYNETFEDGLLNAPGLNASDGVVDSGGLVDSVDGDDGLVNGSCSGCRSWFSLGVSFSFDAGVLGALPTVAGLVWTDGSNPIIFRAYDASGNLIGELTGTHADGSIGGTTAEDRFYGVIHAGGISQIYIMSGDNQGQEVDHVQYGHARLDDREIPEPGSYGLMMGGLLALALRRRRAA